MQYWKTFGNTNNASNGNGMAAAAGERMSLAAQLAAPHSPTNTINNNNGTSGGGGAWAWPSFMNNNSNDLPLDTGVGVGVDNGSNNSSTPSVVDVWCMKYCSCLPPFPSLALTRPQRIAFFIMMLSFGVLLMIMAFMLYLPRIVLGSSYKFAMCIALGNLFLLLSPLPLAGRSHISMLFASHRLTPATAYFASLLLTLMVSFQLPSLFIVVPSLIVQLTCTVWYGMTWIPGGSAAFSRIASLLSSSLFRRTILPL